MKPLHNTTASAFSTTGSGGTPHNIRHEHARPGHSRNSTMQPTVSPWAWVSSLDRRARTRAAGEYARSHDRAAPRMRDHDKYAFYGLRKDSRHFVRLDPLAKGLLLNRQWLPTNAPVTWRVDRFHDTESWGVPDIKVYNHQSIQSYRPYEPVSIVLPGSSGSGSGGQGPAGAAGAGSPHGWSYAARGWAAGAVVLALLVLIVRAAENCLHKKLFKAIYMHTNVGAGELQQDILRGHYRLQGVRRQESDEWSTPNVMATMQHHNFDVGSLPRLDDIDAYTEPSQFTSDLPPPYSECARASVSDLNKYMSEEPPPPYSACYVSYTNPKHGEPQVHIESRRRQNILDERAHSSTEIDNVQNDLIENGLRTDSVVASTSSDISGDVDPGARRELVFDNGRIVERLSLDLNSNNNETEVASNDNVGEPRRAEFKDRVVYIDETASESTTPDRVVLV